MFEGKTKPRSCKLATAVVVALFVLLQLGGDRSTDDAAAVAPRAFRELAADGLPGDSPQSACFNELLVISAYSPETSLRSISSVRASGFRGTIVAAFASLTTMRDSFSLLGCDDRRQGDASTCWSSSIEFQPLVLIFWPSTKASLFSGYFLFSAAAAVLRGAFADTSSGKDDTFAGRLRPCSARSSRIVLFDGVEASWCRNVFVTLQPGAVNVAALQTSGSGNRNREESVKASIARFGGRYSALYWTSSPVLSSDIVGGELYLLMPLILRMAAEGAMHQREQGGDGMPASPALSWLLRKPWLWGQSIRTALIPGAVELTPSLCERYIGDAYHCDQRSAAEMTTSRSPSVIVNAQDCGMSFAQQQRQQEHNRHVLTTSARPCHDLFSLPVAVLRSTRDDEFVASLRGEMRERELMAAWSVPVWPSEQVTRLGVSGKGVSDNQTTRHHDPPNSQELGRREEYGDCPIPGRPTLILSMCGRYGPSQLKMFVSSFLRYHSHRRGCTKLVLFVEHVDKNRELKKHNPDVILVSMPDWKRKMRLAHCQYAIMRPELLYLWLKEEGSKLNPGYVFAVDSRDTFFQQDASIALLTLIEPLKLEIADHGGQFFAVIPEAHYSGVADVFNDAPFTWHRQWLHEIFGVRFHRAFSTLRLPRTEDPFPILCSGLYLGTFAAMLDGLFLFARTIDTLGYCAPDQGVFNGMVAAGFGISGYPHASLLLNPYRTPFTQNLRRQYDVRWNTSTKEVVNCNGEPYAMAHQLDRHKEVWRIAREVHGK